MKSILIVTSSDYFVRVFLIPYIKALVDEGWLVHVASAYDGEDIPYIHQHIDIPVERTPFSLKNWKAIKMLSRQIECSRYDIVHCHTPVGAYIGRLAARRARRLYGTKVIYTAHGFHFYDGAPLLSWLLYYPAEQFLSRYTDAIVTINKEDSLRVERRFTRIAKRYYLPGVGYDEERIKPDLSHISVLREELGLHPDDFVLIYTANLIAGKNHCFLLSCLQQIVKEIPRCKLLLCGEGSMREIIANKVEELHLQQHVVFAGFTWSIGDYMMLADVAVSASRREGLPLSIIEAMSSRLPVVATRIRGIEDLIENNVNGLLYTLDDKEQFCKHIISLYKNPQKRQSLSQRAAEGIERYSAKEIVPQMIGIYHEILGTQEE